MNVGVHPIILIAVIGALLALGAVVVACTVRSGGVRALMIVLALVCLIPAGFVLVALHPELVDGRFRTYKAFYRDIQIGMTRDEVLAVLDQHYPASGARQRPKIMEDEPESLGFFMNPERSREPNCEGIFLRLEQGRVTKKDYSPD
jgi:hypothetical protein